MERDLTKRRVRPPPNLSSVLDIADLGESSDDSDYCIDDDELNAESNSDFSTSGLSNTDESNEEDEPRSPDRAPNLEKLDKKTLPPVQANKELIWNAKICSICLGDKNDKENEIMDCDGCGITVHEGCYGLQDCISISSNGSSCSTEPWFCEACRAGIDQPSCQLCPNTGGIFKETDSGQWVHLICALYVPGVAFGDVEKLSNVTLFELPATKWGSKPCQLCKDYRFARCGIAIQCDAGLCRVHFHTTCAQKEGLLSDATSEDVEQADPFFAHCKLHADEDLIRKKKRNWLTLQLRIQQVCSLRKNEQVGETFSWKRNQRKLLKYQSKYFQSKAARNPPTVPTQKIPRLLTTSASACRALWLKSTLMGFDMSAHENCEMMISSLRDVPKKWNILPAFNVEFVGYFLDRDSRVKKFKDQLFQNEETYVQLSRDQAALQEKYNQLVAENADSIKANEHVRKLLQRYLDVIRRVKPNSKYLNKSAPNSHQQTTANHPLAILKGRVPTAAALKAGVGFPLRTAYNSPNVISPSFTKEDGGPSVKLNNRCGICHQSNDQHLLAKCDKCQLFYHLGCLNPPLTRLPKKTKLMGWQCSECDNNSSSSGSEVVDTQAPRRLRKNSKEKDYRKMSQGLDDGEAMEQEVAAVTDEKKKKKRKNKHHSSRSFSDNSPSDVKKRKTDDATPLEDKPRQGIKLFIKSVPNASGHISHKCSTDPTTSSTVTNMMKPTLLLHKAVDVKHMPRASSSDACSNCDTCNRLGTSANMVKCDECSKNFHFTCLDPPVKKSPKVRGYSWHCANCDPTDIDE